MRKLVVLLNLITLLLVSCNNDGNEQSVKAGNGKMSNVTNLDPAVTLPTPDYQYGGDEIHFDIDQDGVNDFTFRYYLYHGNLGSGRTFHVGASHGDAMIAVDPGNPKIFETGEVISVQEIFKSDQFILYDYKRTPYHQTESGEEEFASSGALKDLDQQYIAFKILANGQSRLGWFKVGLLDDNKLLHIYSYGLSKTGEQS